MIIKGKEYLTYEEIRPIALEQMRKEFKEKHNTIGHKFLGDVHKLFDNKKDIGKWLSDNGYIRIRKQINNIRQFYYIQLDKLLNN